MFPGKIFDKGWSFLLRGGGLDPGGARQAQRSDRAPPHGSPRSEMLFNIDFLDEAHSRSSLTVACLNGARLEQSLES
ncbi:MAG: hypothetical protein WBE38_07360 [Terracidiphilus sp.]|jgi:hypothetical protein